MKKNKVKLFLILVMFFSSFLVSIENMTNGAEVKTEDVKVLVLLDHEYGLNVPGILAKFEQFGWDYTTAGPDLTIDGCETTQGGQPYDVDILYSDIGDISEYHCINIMPGEGHANLLANKDGILNVIKNANSDDKIISAWCRAVRVLAEADIIDGLNVTGHPDYESEYISAGADYTYDTPPIIDENIVTTRRSNFYQKEMCVSIAKAIGCYEKDQPIVTTVKYKTGRILLADITDESGILSVKATLKLTSEPEDITVPALYTLTMVADEGSSKFNCTVPETLVGEYTVDLEITDIFWNDFKFVNETTIKVRTGNLSIDNLTIVPIAIISLEIITIIIKRRKK